MAKLTLLLLYMFVVIMPIESALYFENAFSFAKILGVLLLGSAFVAFLSGHPVRSLSPPVAMRVAIFILCCLSCIWSFDQSLTCDNVPRLAQILIFALLIWEFAVTYKDHLWLFRSFLAGMVVLMTMSLLAHRGAQMDPDVAERVIGAGQDANYAAYMCSVSILVAIYLAASTAPLDRNLRWCYWGFVVWCALQSILTGSRGGFVCLLAAGLFAFFLAADSRQASGSRWAARAIAGSAGAWPCGWLLRRAVASASSASWYSWSSWL